MCGMVQCCVLLCCRVWYYVVRYSNVHYVVSKCEKIRMNLCSLCSSRDGRHYFKTH